MAATSIPQKAHSGLFILDKISSAIVNQHVTSMWINRIESETPSNLTRKERKAVDAVLESLKKGAIPEPLLNEKEDIYSSIKKIQDALHLLEDFESFILRMNHNRSCTEAEAIDPIDAQFQAILDSLVKNNVTEDLFSLLSSSQLTALTSGQAFDLNRFISFLHGDGLRKPLTVALKGALGSGDKNKTTFTGEELNELIARPSFSNGDFYLPADVAKALMHSRVRQPLGSNSSTIDLTDYLKLMEANGAICNLLEKGLLPDKEFWKVFSKDLDVLSTNYMTPRNLVYLEYMPEVAIDFEAIYLFLTMATAAQVDDPALKRFLVNTVVPACLDPNVSKFFPGVGKPQSPFARQFRGWATDSLDSRIVEEGFGAAMQSAADNIRISVIR